MPKPRLTRLERIHLKYPIYFLTLCTFQRKKILNQTDLHDAFILFCEQAASHGAFVGQYVLMPDHLHLFVSLSPHGVTLSAWVKSLKNSLSKSWRSSGVTSPHWQKSFFDHILRTKESYAEKWDYVAANPVRAGLAVSPEAWPYQGAIHELLF